MPGWWQVEVPGGELPQGALAPVEVRRRHDGRPSVVEIRVPNPRLEGRVTDAEGEGIAEGRVLVLDEASGRFVGGAHLLPNGDFVLEALPPRPLLVEARTKQGVSDAVAVELREGPPSPPIHLIVGEARELEGLVADARGPLPGARVQLRPFGGALPTWTTLGTDLHGRFRIPVAPSTSAVDLVVLAPGHPVRILRQPLSRSGDGDRPISVAVPDVGGSLRLTIESGADLHGLELVHGAVRILLADLISAHLPDPTVLEPGSIFLPRLEAGPYTLCTASGSCREAAIWPTQTTELRLTREGAIR